jgi:general secretion pathway protein D
MRRFVRWIVLVLTSLAVSACGVTLDESRLLESKLDSKPNSQTKQQRLHDYLDRAARSENDKKSEGLVKLGNDRFFSSPDIATSVEGIDGQGDAEGDIRLNLVEVPVSVAAKSVLGDVLELNYSVDARVQGNVTLQTSQPASRNEVLKMFEGALRDLGAGIVGSGGNYRVVPLAEAARSVVPISNRESAGEQQVGLHPTIVALKYISADEIREVIEPLVPPGMIVRTDTARNAIILSGTSSELAAIQETIAVFDVDWMRGMSFALVSVKSSQPGAIISDLEQIYDTKRGPLRNVVRFVPNRRLKSVLIITSRSKYIKEATAWIRKLDALASTEEQGLHVYRVQNRTAAELAGILQSVLKSQGTGSTEQTASTSERVAPRLPQQVAVSNAENSETGGPETPPNGLGSGDDATLPDETSLISAAKEVAVANGVRVVADDANNSLLIFATDAEYQRIHSVLEEVDSQANQVLLEAVIAEVSLDDELKFGVRWLFGENRQNATFSDIASGAIAQSFPGFSYFLRANDISLTLNALSSVTDVRVLSSPSLVVLDNKTAVLQVGDQVPIVTQSARGTTTADAPIVNNVELKDTGVILSVTPRVNDSGRVILDIEQEVSSVVKTTTSGIDSPTIRQRKIKTSVVVTDGEALALGGMIQEKETTGKAKVPILGDVPLLGNAFRQKTNNTSRTELIIFIRPRVIRDMNEARRVTKEFQRELGVKAPRVRSRETTPLDEAVRILN